MNRLNTNRFVYTHQLPYGTRIAICNLLDADQSWRTLAGQFIGLDATQLTLLGQAFMRNGSPTDELLNKLDSANLRIEEFYQYLKQMNHIRALELLKPYINMNNVVTNSNHHQQQQRQNYESNNQDELMFHSNNSTLDTPTPSFGDITTPAIMDVNPFEQAHQLQYPFLIQQQQQSCYKESNTNQVDMNNLTSQPSKCHKNKSTAINHIEQNNGNILNKNDEQKQQKQYDPGEEIVRMACTNNRKRTSISDQEVVNQLRLIMQITYNELKQASNNFSPNNKLGDGGFASVYRGNWKGTDVAIKRLKCNLMDQALNELTILNSYRIDNILPIYGISIDGPEACLVYQFMSNGSLEDRLACKKGTKPLTWSQRALIGEGVAKGLYYLHTLRDKPLVHGDVKSANVLLDSQMIPKLGDFGLARQVFKGKNNNTNPEHYTHCTVSSIHGTSVYLPPEYLRHKILSPAVDVYSYGIVLLEMATGRRAYDGKRLLIDIVEDETKSMSMGQISYSLKDSQLADDTQNDLKIWYELLIKLGLNCAHKIKKKRLDMGQVLNCFSSFRNNSNNNIDSNYLNSNNNSLTSSISSTARTLTPDMFGVGVSTANKYTKEQQSNTVDTQIDTNQQQNYLKQYLQKSIINNNSSLMVVEEEDQQQKQQHNNHKIILEKNEHDRAVEAMIPLLTELGVVQKNDDEIKNN